MYRYCPLVSAADGIIAPFTSQTSPVCPTVILLFKTVIQASHSLAINLTRDRPSRFLLEPLPTAPALPPSMAVVKPGRSTSACLSRFKWEAHGLLGFREL